jgi:hypothetical protein
MYINRVKLIIYRIGGNNMNKKIKRIIAMTLIISSFFAVGPTTQYLSFNGTQVAYASDDDEDEGYLSDIDLSEGSLTFSEKKTAYTVRLDGSDEDVTITATAKKSTDNIKIDGTSVSLDGNKRAEKKVALNRGRNLIKIKVETLAYGVRTYTLTINRGSASTSESVNEGSVYLNSITLSDGSISFSKNKISYDVNVASNIEEIRIAAQPQYDSTIVKINDTKVTDDEKFRRTIKLVNGKNVVLIGLEDENGNEQTYTLNIYRGGAVDNSTIIDTEQDPIYLDDIILDDGDIPIRFKPKATKYAVNIAEDKDSVILKADPQYDDVIRIDGRRTESPYRDRIQLEKGKNVIEIEVNNSNTYDKEDSEYEKRIYTLTIYRGTSQGTAVNLVNTANSNANANATLKTNQWINNNGKWQYNDAIGNSLKNMWFFDKNYNAWYYLDEMGNMKTGWIQAGNGKWYYLYPSGAMAYNTIVDGCKLDGNGVWVK